MEIMEFWSDFEWAEAVVDPSFWVCIGILAVPVFVGVTYWFWIERDLPALKQQLEANMTSCLDCRMKVSKRAEICPHCGAPRR